MLHGRTAGSHFFVLPQLIATAPKVGSLRCAAKSWIRQGGPLTAQGYLETQIPSAADHFCPNPSIISWEKGRGLRAHTLFGSCWHQSGDEVARRTKPEYKQAEGRGETEKRDEGGSANQRKNKLGLKYKALKRWVGCYWDIWMEKETWRAQKCLQRFEVPELSYYVQILCEVKYFNSTELFYWLEAALEEVSFHLVVPLLTSLLLIRNEYLG